MHDPEIDAIFLAEAKGRLSEVEHILAGPFPSPGTSERAALLRHAHTIKGLAGSLGHHKLEDLAQDIYARLDERSRAVVPPEAEREVRREFSEIYDELRKLASTRDAPR